MGDDLEVEAGRYVDRLLSFLVKEHHAGVGFELGSADTRAALRRDVCQRQPHCVGMTRFQFPKSWLRRAA